MTTDRMGEALSAADAVIVAASHAPGRPPALDAAAIAALPTGAILVNVARDGVIDNEAALDAVRTGHLAGLGLDVFPEEPSPFDGPLLAHPRVLATAHAAALTSDYFHAAAALLGDALERFAAGQPPANLLNDVPAPAPEPTMTNPQILEPVDLEELAQIMRVFCDFRRVGSRLICLSSALQQVNGSGRPRRNS